MTTASARRSGQAGFLFFVTLVWNGIVSVFLLAGLGLLRVTYEGPSVAEPGTWGYWLFLLPFCLGGTGIFLGFLWSAFGREEWRVSCDALEVLRAIPGRAWSRVYSAATLTIEIGLDNDLDEIGSLILVAADETRLLKRGEPAAMRALGQFLATETGWELREATSG